MSFENGDLLLVEKPAHCTVPVSPPITDTLSKLTHVPLYPFPFKPFLGNAGFYQSDKPKQNIENEIMNERCTT